MAKPNTKGIRDTNWQMEWKDMDPERERKLVTQTTLEGKPVPQMTIEKAIERKRDNGDETRGFCGECGTTEDMWSDFTCRKCAKELELNGD